MKIQRICEICGKEHESSLVIRCIDCLKEKLNVKNKTEKLFRDLAEANGWEVTKRGYPDFICYKDNDFVFVEVKSKDYPLTPEQEKFKSCMIRHGIKFITWRPTEGFILNKI